MRYHELDIFTQKKYLSCCCYGTLNIVHQTNRFVNTYFTYFFNKNFSENSTFFTKFHCSLSDHFRVLIYNNNVVKFKKHPAAQ